MVAQRALRFGKYRGVPLADVPELYLSWLIDQPWLHHQTSEAVADELYRRELAERDHEEQQRETEAAAWE